MLRLHGPLSRADLARYSGLSEGSISRITSELMVNSLVREDGAESSSVGRPGTRLRLDERRIGIGVEIGRDKIQIAAATLAGKIIDRTAIPTPSTPADVLNAIVDALRNDFSIRRKHRIEGVGVSVRGIVNSRTGVVEYGNLFGWIGIPVKEFLEEHLNWPVEVDNNVRLAARAEYSYGNLLEVRNSHCLLFAMVDDGIGIGIVLDGKVYYGPNDAAGEFGQMVIADKNDDRPLDRAGSLERLASITALCERYAELSRSQAPNEPHSGLVLVKKICRLAMAGDTVATTALSEICRYLGIGLANVIWGLNADAVVIDSSINEAWPFVAPRIQSQFAPSEDIVTFRNLVLRPASLSGEASTIGAATLPFRTLFASGESARKAPARRSAAVARG
jgi:predicted NBD/HSP70 family sugar kinase